MFVLEVPENEGVIRAAADNRGLSIDKVGPYFRISAATEIVIDRRATGCRHAVWYSAVAGLQDAVVTQHDKDALRVSAR
jgi:hypothetical protein